MKANVNCTCKFIFYSRAGVTLRLIRRMHNILVERKCTVVNSAMDIKDHRSLLLGPFNLIGFNKDSSSTAVD